MADLIVTLLKVAFVAALWIFVLIVAGAIRTDIMGGRMLNRRPAPAGGSAGPVPSSAPQATVRTAPAAQPRILAITSGSQAGARLAMVDHFRIGRSADCALILDDDYVSGDHAEMKRRADGQWVLTDLGSTNGSFVNGARLSAPTIVTAADDIKIGRTQMRLET